MAINDISRPIEKVDNREKLTGNACYLADMAPEGMYLPKHSVPTGRELRSKP